ncbi:hypothetical protein Btru_048854 [Bulinus truncatus]|nr:hypothetical protein Btru_048854 [Bulinus truncatus]
MAGYYDLENEDLFEGIRLFDEVEEDEENRLKHLADISQKQLRTIFERLNSIESDIRTLMIRSHLLLTDSTHRAELEVKTDSNIENIRSSIEMLNNKFSKIADNLEKQVKIDITKPNSVNGSHTVTVNTPPIVLDRIKSVPVKDAKPVHTVSVRPFVLVCYSCRRIGHRSKTCPKRLSNILCFNCHLRGHVARHCPSNSRKQIHLDRNNMYHDKKQIYPDGNSMYHDRKRIHLDRSSIHSNTSKTFQNPRKTFPGPEVTESDVKDKMDIIVVELGIWGKLLIMNILIGTVKIDSHIIDRQIINVDQWSRQKERGAENEGMRRNSSIVLTERQLI